MNIYNAGQQYGSYGAGNTPSNYGTGRNKQSGGQDSPFNISNAGTPEETTGGSGLVDLESANRALLLADNNLDGIVDQQELAMVSYPVA